MSNLKYRMLGIAALVAVSAWFLFPRTVHERRFDRTTDSWTTDTVTRVPLKKGLDLAGGVHLALEIDESRGAVADREGAIERALTVVRNRIDEFGVAEPVVQRIGDDRIVVELPGLDDPERAQELVQQSAFLEFQITDKTQALERVLPRLDGLVRERGLEALTPATAPAARPEATPGIQQLFTPADTGAARQDTARGDTAQVPGATGGSFSRLVQMGQIPGEYYVATADVPTMRRYLDDEMIRAALPPGKVVRWSADTAMLGNRWYRAMYVLDSRAIITGQYLIDARPTTDPIEGVTVQFRLNNEGGRRFRVETGRHIQDYMAIVLDQRVMGRPPVIQGAIGTSGQITMGGRDLQAAQDLALVLRAGSLPVPLRTVEIRRIGASLGQDSIDAGIMASSIAVGLVIVIMLAYYRFSGVLAVTALSLYVVFTLGILAGFGAVLTLPGLAGFILGIGIAVDANVLIFERIREELDAGKTVRTAIDEGFNHAMSAIVDANVTTALTALVLYQFGTGPVRGFAVTLLAGIVASMISAIFVVRTFFLLWLSRSRGAQTLSI
ncbi:MAG TPA: protein translocase subunit SecD [Gemmatimonadaceae bacterium]|nr:protein translocase subunit SecD [Gemmatimonadaceae bacterium]